MNKETVEVNGMQHTSSSAKSITKSYTCYDRAFEKSILNTAAQIGFIIGLLLGVFITLINQNKQL